MKYLSLPLHVFCVYVSDDVLAEPVTQTEVIYILIPSVAMILILGFICACVYMCFRQRNGQQSGLRGRLSEMVSLQQKQQVLSRARNPATVAQQQHQLHHHHHHQQQPPQPQLPQNNVQFFTTYPSPGEVKHWKTQSVVL